MQTHHLLMLIMTFFLMACQDVAPECLTEDGIDEACVIENEAEQDDVIVDSNDPVDSVPEPPLEDPSDEPDLDGLVNFTTNVEYFNFDERDK